MNREERKALTVTQLNEYVKMVVDNNPVLGNLCVRGEISNYTKARSGHLYFTLKDEGSSVKAVMFVREASKLVFEPESGMHVVVCGRLSVYPRDGNYQLYCNLIEPEGIGSLYLAFEQLKKKLEDEGLFASELKKPLPFIPRRVGVVTSPTGAAIKDILSVAQRRFPAAEIVIYPSLVQRAEAEEQLVAGIDHFNAENSVDVIIIGRGGGSAEDLWVFNSEKLARHIVSCRIPVVSAVGHERDYSICDYAADLRAPTPSAAAEAVFPDRAELRKELVYNYNRLKHGIANHIGTRKMMLDNMKNSRCLTSFINIIDDKRMYFDSRCEAFEDRYKRILTDKRHALQLFAAKLDGVSPLTPLARGYSVMTKDGEVVTDSAQLAPDDSISVTLNHGAVNARITEIVK